MKKILFIDRDGTIIKEPLGDFQVDSLEKLEFIPHVISALKDIVNSTDYRLIMVTNQDGLGTSSFPMEDFSPPHKFMLKTLMGEGVCFDEILIDSSFADENSPRRKPATGMVEKYLNNELDKENSYVIGDRKTDMILAANMGIRGIYIGEEIDNSLPVALSTNSWLEIADFIKNGSRKTSVKRKTAETDITIKINLNGNGKSDINTGLSFFNHMLEQIAKHSGIDLTIDVQGDLNVDEHHTIEDTAIVLGECFNQVLGNKKGISRYGFSLPMDESKAEILLDFGGRSWLEWDVQFDREYVGDFPTEMTKHFFASFCGSAKCNMHINCKGDNTHHKIEAIFKAFARSIKMAVKQDGFQIPSSKGII